LAICRKPSTPLAAACPWQLINVPAAAGDFVDRDSSTLGSFITASFSCLLLRPSPRPQSLEMRAELFHRTVRGGAIH
jgi:hypothetical protein